MASIKLPKIPVEETVLVKFKMLGSKHAELMDYLAYFNEAHGSDIELKTLLPHLISAFIAEDRGFVRWRSARSGRSDFTSSPNASMTPRPPTGASS